MSRSVPRRTRPMPDLLPLLYRMEASHWWSAGMRFVSHALLPAHLPAGWIVEVGCGSGVFALELAQRYPISTVLGVELRYPALRPQRLGPATNAYFLQGDLQRLPLPAESAGTMVALDVMDQAGSEPILALAEARRILRPGGLLLVRVSAYDWLHGPHDQAFGTAHRFTAGELARLLLRAGFRILRLTYANSLLLPIAVVARLAQRAGWLSPTVELGTPVLFSGRLRHILQAEAAWLRQRDLPAGLSLYALAKKEHRWGMEAR